MTILMFSSLLGHDNMRKYTSSISKMGVDGVCQWKGTHNAGRTHRLALIGDEQRLQDGCVCVCWEGGG